MTKHYSTADREAIRSMIRRAAIAAVNDEGTQQLLDLTRLAADLPKKIVRVESFGLASNPPSGGNGLMVCPGGRSELAMFIGGEHPQFRPRNTESGGTIIYDANGQAISLVKNNLRIVGEDVVTVQCTTLNLDATTINLVGNINLGAATGTVPIELAGGGSATKVKAV